MNTPSVTIVETADGSKTLFNPQIGENYHSKHGALQESQHVFVNSGLAHYHQLHNQQQVSILELGFGTGLNFLLSADYAISQQIQLNYRGIEAYPLSVELLKAIDYSAYINTPHLYEQYLAAYDSIFTERKLLYNSIQLKVEPLQLLDFTTEERFDIIYFDAFAKIHQEEMWTYESIAHICKFLKDKGIFVTYSVTGDLKRALKSLGFTIERPQGAAGKREMMRATLIEKNDL